ncbi:MAG: hypothetical protein K5930_02320 [Treponemataceae bacterium]|nr:hypothetical protein [Treponemataceae bacterium]
MLCARGWSGGVASDRNGVRECGLCAGEAFLQGAGLSAVEFWSEDAERE